VGLCAWLVGVREAGRETLFSGCFRRFVPNGAPCPDHNLLSMHPIKNGSAYLELWDATMVHRTTR
jgi:hypothetical protein